LFETKLFWGLANKEQLQLRETMDTLPVFGWEIAIRCGHGEGEVLIGTQRKV
jgi:hypothetical protein